MVLVLAAQHRLALTTLYFVCHQYAGIFLLVCQPGARHALPPWPLLTAAQHRRAQLQHRLLQATAATRVLASRYSLLLLLLPLLPLLP